MQALVLVAHGDDESLGVGGTIPKLVKNGWSVRVAVVASGIVDARGTRQDNRPAAREACRLLGVGDPTFLGFTDEAFESVPLSRIIDAVYGLQLDPDLVITHSDDDLNSDHRLTCEAAKVFCRPCRRKPTGILGCEVPGSSFWNGRPFAANYFVDISETIDTKIKAFASYGHELRPFPDPWSRDGLRLLAQYHGMQCGFRFAEAFKLIRGFEGRMP